MTRDKEGLLKTATDLLEHVKIADQVRGPGFDEGSTKPGEAHRHAERRAMTAA